jgi:DNA adenine methylase
MTELKPLYKWSGGKRKEIKIFKDYYPDFVKENNSYKYIEPFFGGGAVYWSLNAKYNIINDIDTELIIFLKQIKNNSFNLIKRINSLSIKISKISQLEKENKLTKQDAKKLRGEYYYLWRNKDRNGGLKNLTKEDKAFRFFLVNQLSFNGMRRFNSKGEFNIPYGNYKSFNIHISDEHINLLNKTGIYNKSYNEIMLNNDNDNTFIYLDPPYTREFKEYSHNNSFGNDQQIKLFNIFKNMKKSKIMLIINKDDFTYNLYKDYIKHEYDLKYSTNIKNRYDNSVKHLIICNY